MKLTADEYFQAAQDHVEEARILYDLGRHALSHYVAGLAVECLLRAYAVRNKAPFDSRHDLDKSFEAARFDEVVASSRLEAISEAYNTVVIQWSNTQRYYSIAFLRVHFRNAKLDRGIRGNTAKELTRRINEAALVLINEGIVRWNNWKNQ